MAIRNFISGDAQIPQVADPLQQFAKVQGARNLLQQGQQNEQQLALGEQHLQTAKAAAEKAARVERDQQAFSQAYLEAKGNPVETIKLASTRGVHPDIIQGFEKHVAEIADKHAQSEAHLLPIKKQKIEQAQGLLMQVGQMPPEQLTQNWPMLYQKALELDPSAKEFLSPMQPPNAQQLAFLNAAVATQGHEIAMAQQKRLDAEEARKVAGESRTAQQFAVEQPVRAAVAGATLADPKLLAPAQRSQADIAETNAKATAAYRAETLGQRRERLAMERQRMSGGAGMSDNAIQKIKENPDLFYTLTPTDRRKMLDSGALKDTDLGKPLSEKGVQTFSDMETGINMINETVSQIRQGENNMGPFAGFLTSNNPWASDAGKRLKSQIELTRQVVGSAWERGVLRKEDEIKYKAILADINNTPSSAIAKLENVRNGLDQNLKTWEKNQRSAGRSVPPRNPAGEGGGQPSDGGKPVVKWNREKGVRE